MNFVFDNVIYSKEKQGGISNYWFQITKNFTTTRNAFFYEEKDAAENIFRRQLQIDNLLPHVQYPLQLARLMPIRYKSSTDAVLYHSSFYRQLITSAEVFEVTTIHDFTHNHYAAPLNRKLHNYLKYGSIQRSKGIICISNNTFNDLKKYCKIKKGQKTTVIYNGVSNDYKPLNQALEHPALFKKLKITGKYLLFVGARTHYKNFSFCLQLLKEMKDFKLVIVGKELKKAECSAIDPNLADRIVIAESISNEDLNILYNSAVALLYPSFYEGFGIPIAEAMKAGCPVLALNTSSITEVAADAGLLFDHLSLQSFSGAIRKLENKDYRQGLTDKGLENARRFDWGKCYQETREFYGEVYGAAV